MYVEPNPGQLISWADSYNLAKTYRLNGMVGYLVTITSATEDNVLDNINNKGAWAGGNRWAPIGDADSIPAWPDNSATLRSTKFERFGRNGESSAFSLAGWSRGGC